MEFNATFLATIVTFILFVILMNKILYAPILNIMLERRNFIDKNYQSAQDNNTEADRLNQEKDSKLIEARELARNKYNESVEEYKTQRSEVLEEANAVAKNEIEQSRIDLENLSNEVKNGLKGSMIDLANDIVERVIGYRSEVQGFDDEVVNKVLWEK